MARDLKEVSATGNVTAVVPARLFTASLTSGADASSIAIRDGASGAVRLTVKSPANTTTVWGASSYEGVLFGTAIHVTFITGTAPVASFEFS